MRKLTEFPRTVNKYISGKQDSWRRLFGIAFDPVWCTVVVIAAAYSVIETLHHSMGGTCRNNEYLVYLVYDVLFLIDLILYLGCLIIRRMYIPEMNLATRSKFVVACELLALFPVTVVVPVNTELDQKVYCLFRLIRVLKVARLWSYQHNTSRYLMFPSVVIIAQYFFTFILIITFTMSLMSAISFISYQYLLANNPTMNETSDAIQDSHNVDVMTEMSEILRIVLTQYVFNAITAYFALMMIAKHLQKTVYNERFASAMSCIAGYNTPRWLVKSATRIFDDFWSKQGGYEVGTECLNFLSSVTRNAVKLNVCYGAFQHSRMFRRMPGTFLRNISNIVEIKYYFPGEYVYRVGDHKGRMLYVVTGVIEILSDEDGFSPILSFTAGTCIGDSTLFVGYKSPSAVRCRTFCEIHAFNMRTFHSVLSAFKNERTFLRKIVYQRYANAMSLKNLRKDVDPRRDRCLSTVWLKNTLHNLMSVDKDSSNRHKFPNMFLVAEHRQAYRKKSTIFTALYLDTLAIHQRVPLEDEKVLLKRNFPILLKPDSFALYTWEGFVLLLAVLAMGSIIYVAFITNQVPLWYFFLNSFVTIVFMIDVAVILMTSGYLPSGALHTNFKENVKYQFSTFNFWCAVTSAFPFELFTSLIITEITTMTTALMHTNRLCKLIKVIWYLLQRRKNYKTSLLLSWFIIVFLLETYWIYVAYCLLNVVTTKYRDDQLMMFIQAVLLCNNHRIEGLTSPIYGAMNFMTQVLFMCGTVGISAALILHCKTIKDIQERAHQIFEILHDQKNSITCSRLLNYLNTQYLDNGSFYFFYDKETSVFISQELKSEIASLMIFEDLGRITFFSVFSETVLLSILSVADTKMYPPEEIITHIGDVSDSIYIFHRGSADVVDENGKVLKSLHTIAEINLLEMIFSLPLAYTTVCRSHCSVIKISRRDFSRVLLKHWDDWMIMQKTISDCQDLKEKCLDISRMSTIRSVASFLVLEKKNIKQFSKRNIRGSFDEYDYYYPFDRMHAFRFIRFFLLKVTFHPNGKILHVWETGRILIAVASSLASFCIPILMSKYKFWLLFFDLTVVVDMYFRCHVGYYNEKGLLVTHPLYTASHYLTHGFIGDLIGILPFRYFYKFNVITEVILNATRLLQLNRYVQFIWFSQRDVLKRSRDVTKLMYIPLVLVVANVFACVLFMMECAPTPGENHKMHDTDITLFGFECVDDTILKSAHYKISITMFEAHWFLLWVFTSCLTETVVTGFNVVQTQSVCFLAIARFASRFINVTVFCLVYTQYAFRDTVLRKAQAEVAHLNRWLQSTINSSKLIKVMMATQALRWKRRHKILLPTVVKPFNPALRIDVLEEYYVNLITSSNPFEDDDRRFYRSIVKHIAVDVILIGGYIQTLNDIDNHLYILVDGIADVIAPDGTKLTTLGKGSIFGNLTSKKKSRLKVSIIAMMDVEVLKIPTEIWNKKIAFYPNFEREYVAFRNRCSFYILYPPPVGLLEKLKHLKTLRNQKVAMLMGTSSPSSRLSKLFVLTNMLVPCFLGVMVDLYQATVEDYSAQVVVFQLLCDVIFVGQIILDDRTAYLNGLGFIIRDLDYLRTRNRMNTFYSWLKFVCIHPFDMIVFFSPIQDAYMRCHLFTWLRVPKLARFLLFHNYFRKVRTSLFVSLFWFRLVSVFCWLIAMLECSIFTISYMCYWDVNLNVHIPSCHDIFYLPTNEKFAIYIRYGYILIKSFCGELQNYYYPIAMNTYILFTAIMLSMNLLHIILAARTFHMVYEWHVNRWNYYRLNERLEQFLIKERVPLTVQSHVLMYVKTMWFMWEGEFFPKLVVKASPYLKDVLYNQAYGPSITKHRIFRGCHPDFLRQMIQKIEVRMYFAGQFIQFSDTVDESMYFVYSGQVTVVDEEMTGENAVILWLKAGSSFGIYQGLFKRVPHKYSYRCQQRATILSLYLNDWEYLLNFFPASRELIYKAAPNYKND